MSLFVTAISDIQQPGVFAIEVAPPLVVEGIPNGYIGYVFQGPWGPVDQAYLPVSQGDMIATYFPAGAPHTSTGYYGIVRRKKFNAVMVRILGGAAGLLPPVIVSVAPQNSPGATSVSYRVTAVNLAGETIGSQTFTITNSNSTLDNLITWAAVVGATGYNVYRTAGGATQGKIASNQSGTSFTDNAVVASGAIPTANTTGYAQAVSYLLDSSGVAVARAVAEFPGTLPNAAMTAQVIDASDGVANHFDLVVTLQDVNTGSSSERFPNLQTQATAILPDESSSRLISAFTLMGTPTTRPANATYTFSGGSDGVAVTAADYETGLGQLALRDDISVVVTDDPGDSIRAAVNADVQAHVDAKTDRICVLQGNQNNTLAQVLTDVKNYSDDRVIYVGAWVTVLDDAGKTAVASPFSTFIASAVVNLEPQQSHAWWDDTVTDFYTGVHSILTPQFSTADDPVQKSCTQAGVCLPIRRPSGRFAALHDRTTSSTLDRRFMVTRRIKDFLVKSIANAMDPFVNGPNLPTNWKRIKLGLDAFFSGQVDAGRLVAVDPVDIKSPNTNTTQTAGQFLFRVTGKSPTVMENIIPLIDIGPGRVGVTFE